MSEEDIPKVQKLIDTNVTMVKITTYPLRPPSTRSLAQAPLLTCGILKQAPRSLRKNEGKMAKADSAVSGVRCASKGFAQIHRQKFKSFLLNSSHARVAGSKGKGVPPTKLCVCFESAN